MAKVRFNPARDNDIWINSQDSTYKLNRRGKKPSVIDISVIDTATTGNAWGEIAAPTATTTTETGLAATCATNADSGVVNIFYISGGSYAVDQYTLTGTGEVSFGAGIPIHAWMDAEVASGNILIHLSGVTGTTYLTITGGAVESNGAQIQIPAKYRASIDYWTMTQQAMGTVATDEQLGWLDIRNYESGGANGEDLEYGLLNVSNGYSPVNTVKDDTVYINQETIIPKSKYVNAGAAVNHKIRINVWETGVQLR